LERDYRSSLEFLKLRPYQQEDVKFLEQKKSIGIFNEMRTGKTPVSLAVFSH
jgi:hypothetical protein